MQQIIITQNDFIDIKGYEGLYQINKEGIIKSLNPSGFGKRINNYKKPYMSNKGYLCIDLSKDKKNKHYLLHRLIAENFIPNPNNFSCVNHKDENPLNNNIDNLEWCTKKYNNNYGTIKKRRSKIMTNNTKISHSIIGVEIDNGFIVTYPSIREAERQNKEFNGSTISKCCRKILKKHKNYIWKYYNNEVVCSG